MAPLVTKVKDCLDRWGIYPGGMVVAVSGGPDSIALLGILLSLREHECNIDPDSPGHSLVIAHLNHQLRGAESDADERFVQDLYQALVQTGSPNLHFRCERADVAGHARRAGSNLESTARRIRYRWLA